MYQEWIDGIPLLYEGAYEHNISELKKAISYYEKQGSYSTVKAYEEDLNKEYEKLAEELENRIKHPIKSKLKEYISYIF